jgi:hypothetical protein
MPLRFLCPKQNPPDIVSGGLGLPVNDVLRLTGGTFGAGIGSKGAALSLNYTWVPSALSTNCRQ